MVVVGLEPWARVAAVDLAAAGVGALLLLDDATATGEARIERVRAEARRRAPSCAVEGRSLEVSKGAPPAGLPSGARWDLVVCGAPADDLLVHEAAARFAQEAGAPSVGGWLENLEAVVGPGVVPGETACFRCALERRIACSERPEVERAIAESLRSARAPRRAPIAPEPAAALLGHELARAALDLLTHPASAPIRGRLLVRSLVSRTASWHSVLRLPRCELCGGTANAPRGAAEGTGASLDSAASPASLRRMLAGVLDERTGIVKELRLDAADPSLKPEAPWTATAVLAASPRAHRCRHHATEPEIGAGKGLTRTSALVSAVGEAVERYSAARFEAHPLRRASVRELAQHGEDHLDPGKLAAYSAAQLASPAFPHPRLDDDRAIEWIRGHWLDTKAPVWVPALPTFFDYPASMGEGFCQVTSSGLAAGPTLEDASLRAALELVERDAFMLTWMARLPGRRLGFDDAMRPAAREIVRQLAAFGARVGAWLLDAGTGVPTVLTVGFGDGVRWPGATVAIAAHQSPRRALERSLLEQAHVGPYLRRHLVRGERHIPERAEDVRTLLDHALYYFPPSRAAAFSFLDAGDPLPVSALEEPRELSLEALRRQLGSTGLRIALVDVTSPDLASTPFRVVRALGPELCPIHFGHGLARLGNARLRAMARGAVNPDPHPMD